MVVSAAVDTPRPSTQAVYCFYCHNPVTLGYVPWAAETPPKPGMQISLTVHTWTCPTCRAKNEAWLLGRLSSIWPGHTQG